MKRFTDRRFFILFTVCPDPMPEYGNGIIRSKGPYYLGDTVEYICYDGYVSPVPITMTCEAGPNGPFWTDPVGQCSGKTSST